MIRQGGRAVGQTAGKLVRCAIYTRKSTDDNLEAETNSLEVQREHAEQYIASQAGNRWVCLPERYDDGGWTGANVERPAFQQLMRDIEAGLVDCVVVYKIDRLSRSLADFVTTYETFQKYGVSFVSVTQSFNTNDSVGRLVMHILLSFAEFEREQIIERIRHKMAAMRRKGKWAGGQPPLGYDIAPNAEGAGHLAVNPAEAEVVRLAYTLYEETGSLLETARRMNALGHRTKRRTTAKGGEKGGKPFDRALMHRLLRNRTYVGEVEYKGEVFDGEHEGIVPRDMWDRVNNRLTRQRLVTKPIPRNEAETPPLLQGMVVCKACDRAMTYTRAGGGKRRRYAYYTCTQAVKSGWDSCPAKSLPAAELERFVVDQLRSLAYDDAFRAEVARRAGQLHDAERERLEAGEKTCRQRLDAAERRVRGNARREDIENHAAAQGRYEEARAARLNHASAPTEAELLAATEQYDPVWGELTPDEQRRMVRLLVEKVVVDGEGQRVGVLFRAAGFRQLGRLPAASAAGE